MAPNPRPYRLPVLITFTAIAGPSPVLTGPARGHSMQLLIDARF